MMFVYIRVVVKQWLCEHTEYFEDRKCDAICRNCGKNLGFIGAVRGDK